MTDERTLEKIKKCLALSASSNPHEAAAAMRQAQKLMEMHGVSTVDVAVSSVAQHKAKSLTSTSKPKIWETRLARMVGDAFGCHLMWHSARGRDFGAYIFIGIKSKLEVCEYTFQVLQRQLYKQRQAYAAEHKRGWHSKADITGIGDQFAIGWIDSVKETVHKLVVSDEDQAAIQLFLSKEYPSQGKPVALRGHSGDASHQMAGQAAGKGQSLHRPMTTRNNLMLG
jgi:Protein of unknown function (DUF2786)